MNQFLYHLWGLESSIWGKCKRSARSLGRRLADSRQTMKAQNDTLRMPFYFFGIRYRSQCRFVKIAAGHFCLYPTLDMDDNPSETSSRILYIFHNIGTNSMGRSLMLLLIEKTS